jgi:hypothetical protein
MVTHKIHDGGVNGLMERLKKLSSQKVAVGVPSETDEQGRGESKDVGNADLVYIHTHGVRPHEVRGAMQPAIDAGTKYSTALQMYVHENGSFSMQVPPRPIIEPAIAAASEELGELLGEAAKIAANGEDLKQSLTDVGLQAQQKVQEWFENSENAWAPNSAKTIKQKKSDSPLIDTGALRQSITYVIRGENDD